MKAKDFLEAMSGIDEKLVSGSGTAIYSKRDTPGRIAVRRLAAASAAVLALTVMIAASLIISSLSGGRPVPGPAVNGGGETPEEKNTIPGPPFGNRVEWIQGVSDVLNRIDWDYDGDGSLDTLDFAYAGSGITHSSLYCTSARTCKSSFVLRVPFAAGLGFSSRDGGNPFIYSTQNMLYTSDGLFVEKLGELSYDGERIVLVTEGEQTKDWYTYTYEQRSAESSLILFPAEDRETAPAEVLEKETDFRAYVSTSHSASYADETGRSVNTHVYGRSVIRGEAAKELYLLIRNRKEYEGAPGQSKIIWAGRPSVEITFINVRGGDEQTYYLCGNYEFQYKDSGDFAMSFRDGALHEGELSGLISGTDMASVLDLCSSAGIDVSKGLPENYRRPDESAPQIIDMTMTADDFLDYLRRSGIYAEIEGINVRNGHGEGGISVRDSTPDNRSGFSVFSVESPGVSRAYLVKQDQVKALPVMGAPHTFAAWDYDRNGIDDLLVGHDPFSGIYGYAWYVVDLCDFSRKDVYIWHSVTAKLWPRLTLSDGCAYVDGVRIEWKDGSFVITSEETRQE